MQFTCNNVSLLLLQEDNNKNEEETCSGFYFCGVKEEKTRRDLFFWLEDRYGHFVYHIYCAIHYLSPFIFLGFYSMKKKEEFCTTCNGTFDREGKNDTACRYSVPNAERLLLRQLDLHRKEKLLFSPA